MHREVGRAKDLSAPRYQSEAAETGDCSSRSLEVFYLLNYVPNSRELQ